MTTAAARQLVLNHYEEAERLALLAAGCARRDNDPVTLAKALSNAGAARIYRHRYADAFEVLRDAQAAARVSGRREVEAGIWSNIASLYGMVSAWPLAEQALVQALALIPEESRFRPALLAQRLRLALQREDCNEREADRLWAEAMESAERLNDWQVQRHLWDDLATRRLAAGDVNAAEVAVANSFRLAVLHRLPDPYSLWMLAGRVRLAQGKPREAMQWFRRLERASLKGGTPVGVLDLAAAEARAASLTEGPSGGLAVCRRYWPAVLRWRQSVLPEMTAETAADVEMTKLLDQYVAALLRDTPCRREALAESWAAVEQSRAAGLLRRRTAHAARQRMELTAARIDGRAKLEVAAAKRSSRKTDATAAPPDVQGVTPLPPSGLLMQVQRRLRPGQTLFTFWLSGERPTVWAVTGRTIHQARLPKRQELLASLRQFREAVQSGRSDASAGRALYSILFGRLPEEALASREWLISADDELLLAPLGALPIAGEGPEQARFAAEQHSISLVPSALWMLEETASPPPRNLLAVGDLVHNAADPRWRQSGEGAEQLAQAWPWRGSASRLQRHAELELPSLPGSRRELDAVRRLWQSRGLRAEELTGVDVTRKALSGRLSQDWSDLHFATHVLPAPGVEAYRNRISSIVGEPIRVLFPVGQPFLALSLRRDGTREGLTADSLFELPGVATRVVLNGCSTGTGPAQPGAGIYSFATAWLAAGARSVVASLWQVGDDGEFFAEYYRHLVAGARPSMALHAAQTAMIRSGTWRAQPRYWAAYFHLGKD